MNFIRRAYLVLVVVALIAVVGGHVIADEKAKININTASVKELVKLSKVGEVKAEAIVVYRDEHGKFTKIEDITKVKGIGGKIFEKIKDQITVE